ncbi:uncharacterized protein LOC133931084 [Phragmites australis]|uniref:uncharacterized protein LOC133931084 n=1 Tax=Phragmites australis TaxID=29695 RepID=UPI002D77D046|nr:uncharacterized protein LOC133931084 [Phragmites australis]
MATSARVSLPAAPLLSEPPSLTRLRHGAAARAPPPLVAAARPAGAKRRTRGGVLVRCGVDGAEALRSEVQAEAAVPRSVPVRVAYELQQAGYRYLDVRTEGEFSAGHPQGAVNIPYMYKTGSGMTKNTHFLEQVSRIFGKDDEIIVGCQSGKRSLMAATELCSAGFTAVTDIAGGFSSWRENELPINRWNISCGMYSWNICAFHLEQNYPTPETFGGGATPARLGGACNGFAGEETIWTGERGLNGGSQHLVRPANLKMMTSRAGEEPEKPRRTAGSGERAMAATLARISLPAQARALTRLRQSAAQAPPWFVAAATAAGAKRTLGSRSVRSAGALQAEAEATVPRSVPVRVAHELQQAGHRYLDVRTEGEFSSGHPEGAVNIPYMFRTCSGLTKSTHFLEQVSRIFRKDDEIIVGCQSGKRSLMAATELCSAVSMGFTAVTDIAGGFSSWRENGLPVNQ